MGLLSGYSKDDVELVTHNSIILLLDQKTVLDEALTPWYSRRWRPAQEIHSNRVERRLLDEIQKKKRISVLLSLSQLPVELTIDILGSSS